MKVSDVRRLATCGSCGGVGLHGEGLVMVWWKQDRAGRRRNKQYAHPRCYIRAVGLTRFLALADSELDEVRLADVSAWVFKRLLNPEVRAKARAQAYPETMTWRHLGTCAPAPLPPWITRTVGAALVPRRSRRSPRG